MKKVLSIILMALLVTAVFVSCDQPKHEEDTVVTVTNEASLRAAVEAKDVKTIKLANDITITKILEIGGSKDITLDMNGKTLSEDLGDGSDAGLITVTGNGKLKITGNGKIKHTLNYYEKGDGDVITGYLVTALDNAELTIENGDFYAVMGCIRGGKKRLETGEGYKIYIKGGTFESIVKYSEHYWTLNKMDQTTGKFYVSGGSFVEFNPANGGTESPSEDFLAEGYEVKSETKDSKTIYTVSSKSV